ncbi:MAG: hypothetical protein IPO05_07895 [Flavobacteriales bacterium]|nr:hypothetical protein [Flavobacteriales bacterium]
MDRVVAELRSASDPALVVATRSGLVQRGGDVVAVNGSAPHSFLSAPSNYPVAVMHCNNQGVMTRLPLGLGTAFSSVGIGATRVHYRSEPRWARVVGAD